jgi:hypothetical protein
MTTGTGKFSFKVKNEAHADHGKKIEREFSFPVYQTDSEAQTAIDAENVKIDARNVVIAAANEKETDSTKHVELWDRLSLAFLFTEREKANARQNAYQSAALAYAPVEKTPEQALEDIVRAAIRGGISEAVARQTAKAMLGIA